MSGGPRPRDLYHIFSLNLDDRWGWDGRGGLVLGQFLRRRIVFVVYIEGE